MTVTLPLTLAGGFTVRAQVGRCNAQTPTELVVGINQTLATVIVPVCPALGSSATRGLLIATMLDVQYTVSLPAGWSFTAGSSGTFSGSGQSQQVNFATDGHDGNLQLTATGGCAGSQIAGLAFILTL